MLKLLIVGCSARKKAQPPEPIPALERYDGVFFRVLRKFLRTTGAPVPDVLIISARFGLITGQTPIPDYDQRMTASRAKELAAEVQRLLAQHLAQRSYQAVFVNLGKEYLPTVASVDRLQNAKWASGQIGFRARQMKVWLNGARN